MQRNSEPMVFGDLSREIELYEFFDGEPLAIEWADGTVSTTLAGFSCEMGKNPQMELVRAVYEQGGQIVFLGKH
jgi:hypothetical protein